MVTRVEIEKDILQELYNTERMNMSDIANALDVSRTTILNRIHEFNIQPKYDTQFKQTRNEFSLENFNDGYVDNKGRFRVWKPMHPRAYKEGYILRSIVAYEEYNNTTVSNEYDIHHKDKNKLNDTKENLELIKHGEHTKLHSYVKEAHQIRICKTCEKQFEIERWRLKNPTRGQYCTQQCYNIGRKTT